MNSIYFVINRENRSFLLFFCNFAVAHRIMIACGKWCRHLLLCCCSMANSHCFKRRCQLFSAPL